MSKVINIQNIQMNNYTSINDNYFDLVWSNITTSDDILLKTLNNLIFDHNKAKENLLLYLLNSKKNIIFKGINDIKKFFNIMSPLNLLYNFGSLTWDSKIIKNNEHNLLLFHNSVTKLEYKNINILNYLDLIKKKLSCSNINFDFLKFKSSRFFKTVDLIFIININNFLINIEGINKL